MSLPNNKLTIITDNPICANGAVENSDASYSTSVVSGGLLTLPDSQINVNGVDEGDIISVKTVDVNTNITPSSVGLVGNTLTITLPKTVFIKGLFKAGNDTMETLTIDVDNAGTYTSITDDGGSGSITLSKNAGAFAAFSNPLVLANTDTLVVKRTTSTSAGFFKLTGTYV
jgi:hypothetical protein